MIQVTAIVLMAAAYVMRVTLAMDLFVQVCAECAYPNVPCVYSMLYIM